MRRTPSLQALPLRRRMASLPPRCLALLLPLLMCGGGHAQAQQRPQRVVDQGIQAEFAVEEAAQPGGAQAFSFRLSDTAGGNPMRGLRPAAWLSQRAPDAPAPNCTQKVASYLSGDVLRRADVDLNNFFVLTLNDDATVSVVDPLFGFGGSKLLNLLQLESRGADWALAQAMLVVSMPDAGKVALIDTRQWRIVDTVRTGGHPRRVIAAGNRVWIAGDEGVSAIDTAALPQTTRTLTTLPLGGPVADLAASADGAWLFAASGRRIAIIDARAGRLSRQIDIEGTPLLLAYSPAAQAVYAVDAAQGKLFAIDARDGKLTATVELRAGASQIRFTPDGRYALMPNPTANVVQVLDAASNRIVHTVAIADGPDRISFSDRLAYVRRRDSEIVLMISLDQLGNAGGALGLADFPGGQHAFGAPGSLADNLAGAPEGGSMLVANAADRMVYLYSEGMAAPAGGFSTYGQTPRAVLVVDHGLREAAPGVYATTMPVRQPGLYDVVMFNDAPRLIACFATTIAGDAASTAEATRRQVRVSAVDAPRQLVAGRSARLRFALGGADGRALPAASDVRALAFAAPGVWQRRTAATPMPGNVYEIEFIPPRTGVYYVWIESESLGLPRNNTQFKIFQAVNDQGDRP